MPAAKYAFSWLLLRFSNGNTAIDFSAETRVAAAGRQSLEVKNATAKCGQRTNDDDPAAGAPDRSLGR